MHSARSALDQALRILRRDALTAYFRVAAELEGTVVRCIVEGESFAIGGDGTALYLDPAGGAADAVVTTQRGVILALLDGRLGMLDAVLDRQLTVNADVRLLPRIARAGQAFCEGAIRSRAARALLDELRGAWSTRP